MEEEIECIKYLMTNIDSHRKMLKTLYMKREINDEIYDFIRYQIREYTKFRISLKRMLETRVKKISGTKNTILDAGANVEVEEDTDYVTFFKEAAKVNIMDLEKVKNEYKIKSKTVIKLIDRLIEFEKNNLVKIEVFEKYA